MSTMNISLPESLKSFIDEQVAERGFSSSSEYLRELVRKEQDVAKLRALLLEGASSPIVGEVDEAWFASLRARARSRVPK